MSSSPRTTASKQTMRNIVMATYQEIIMSHYSLLTTLNNTWWTCPQLNQLLINFKRLIGLKITFVIFTYQWWIQGWGLGGPPPLNFRPNRGTKGQKTFFWRLPPPPALSQGLDPALHIPRARLSISFSVPLFSLDDIL